MTLWTHCDGPILPRVALPCQHPELLPGTRTLPRPRRAHEGALRTAFQNLLADTLPQGCSLSPEYGMKGSGGRLVRPDAAILDRNYFPRGYGKPRTPRTAWTSRSPARRKKATRSRTASSRTLARPSSFRTASRSRRSSWATPLNWPSSSTGSTPYTEPEVLGFEEAVGNFEQEVPHLAEGLMRKIDEAHLANKRFAKAFDGFFRLCQTSLNPTSVARPSMTCSSSTSSPSASSGPSSTFPSSPAATLSPPKSRA